MFPILILQEWALSSYRGYVGTHDQATDRQRQRFIYAFDRAVIEELATRLNRRPTRTEILARMSQIIQIIEAEFAGSILPPRPHGL